MWGSLNIVFNFKQNILSYIAKNGVWPTIYFKISRLARVRFDFETPGLEPSVYVKFLNWGTSPVAVSHNDKAATESALFFTLRHWKR
jgi:hypothetical protein